MRLTDIVAQETAVRALLSSIRRSSVAHAYLFAGPRSVGKTTTALALASALNCVEPSSEGDACGRCLSCVRIEGGGDADVTVISPDGNQTRIEQMQEMIRSLNFAPLSRKFRVIIIEQADTLNPSSENCILKILEEPPPYAVLILAVRNPNILLPTIRSRCRLVRFRRARTDEIGEALRSRFDLPEEELTVIAACADGAIGRAFRMASEPEFMEERRTVLEALKDWADGPPIISLCLAEQIRSMAKPAKNSPEDETLVSNLTDMLEYVLSWYADLLDLKVRGGDASVANIDCMKDLDAQVRRYTPGGLSAAVRTIMDTRRYLEGNITPQLALENMFLALRPRGER